MKHVNQFLKVLFTIAFFTVNISTWGQVGFTFNGNQIADNSTITINATAEDWGGGYWVVVAESNNAGNDLRIVNNGEENVPVNITTNVVSQTTSQKVLTQLCVGGSCQSSTTTCSKANISIPAKGRIQAYYDVDFQDIANYGVVKTTYTVTANGTDHTINILYQHLLSYTDIYYTSTDGKIVQPYDVNAFGTSILSNTYKDGQGIITFAGNITAIGKQAFRDCNRLTSIDIPNSVTSIGSSAFSGCSSLSSITIPNSLTSIGNSAFDNCYSIASITIPNSVTSIGEYAFDNCFNLASITIPNSVTSIGNDAFRDCNLSFVIIPKSVESIGGNPFSSNQNLAVIVVDTENTTFDCRDNCNAIIRKSDNTLISGCKNTVIPNSVTSIGSSAFSKCSNLTSITIPNSVTSIGRSAFSGCSSLTAVHINSVESWCKIKFGSSWASHGHKLYLNNVELKDIVIPASIDSINAYTFAYSYLTSITIPNSVTSIGERAFDNCSSLASVTIPNSVKIIESGTFISCSSLTSITIPNSVTSIGRSAFSGCSSLASITIPNSVTNIESSAFFGCSSLASITIPNSVTSIGETAFCKCSNLTSVTIPNSVTSIEKWTFAACSSLTSITIPNSVKSIGYQAFQRCSKLDTITIPNSVTSIGSGAFYECSSLASVTIPHSVTSIGDKAFYECSSLASVTIPNSVTSIGDYAFYGCSNLTYITNLSTTPQTITSDCFTNYSATLHVYEGLMSVYGNADNWCYFTIVEDVPPTKATSITMDASTYYCKVYGTISPSATVNPEATIKTFTWESSDPSVLVIPDANTGQALGLKEGVATITAKTTDGSELSASATVYVGTYNPVTSITLNHTSGKLEINKTLALIATVLPENATAKTVKWTSSNTEIATVSAEGVVTALAPGTANITATSMDGTNIKATCEITVPEFNVKYTDADGLEICRYLASGDDATINDAYKRLEVLQPIENVNVTYTRSFDSKMVGNWQAWFMPFDVDYDDLSDDYEVAQIYGVLMDKAGVPYIAFQKMSEGLVKANVPYAVRVKEAGEAVITTTTTLQQTANTNTFSVQSTANNFTFGGVYENSYLSAEYPTYALNKSGNFALMAESVYLRPFRFYMRITDREDNPYNTVVTPAEVKVVVLGEDETSIENVDFDVDIDNVIYNLGGQKLQKLQKGINIVNGKKILF